MEPSLQGAVARLVHPCLEPLPDGGEPISGTHLTHVQRLGVVLQAAGLLSLLERAGWGLAGWDAARLGRDGRLARLEVAGRLGPARSPRPCQDLLRDLLARLFGGGDADLRGPGPAKFAARSLVQHWQHSLVPLAPDEAVAQLLEASPFLWEPAFAEDRMALAGELHRFDGREETADVWVAGPRRFRRRMLGAAHDLAAVRSLLGGPEARQLWEHEETGDPRTLAAAGSWRAAVAAWELRPPVHEAERVERARALAALGRFEAALGALSGLGSPAALLARAEVQLRLGQFSAVLAAVRELKPARLSPGEAAEMAELAARAFANTKTPEKAVPWLRRALTAAGSAGTRAGLLARIAAAAAAWDRRDLAAMDRLLEESRAALDDPDLAWRWHQARALLELEADDGAERAVAHAEAALRRRRHLPGHQAADLWNEAGRARAAAGDLPGAERAFLHQVRLLEGCDGPRMATLALFNLAEIRLRRGRLAGVREILERSTAENRRAGNFRGLAQDAELWARLELVLGRPEAALAACRNAVDDQERHGLSWRRGELRLLAARALGWLGRPAEAAAALEDLPAMTLRELEPEERPALHALAGDRAAARRELDTIADPGLRALWASVLAGEMPAAAGWSALGVLEPFRAARLVVDLERLLPGAVPVDVRRQASAALRSAGSLPLAEALEAHDGGPWQLAAALLSLLTRETEPQGEAEAPLMAPEEERPGARRTGKAGEMAGESPVFLSALERLDRLAAGDLSLLILGESGTGKELAARRAHRASARASAPFVALNCAALSETLLLSDLFGHVRGAFTGADRDRPGVFQTAEGGTVFLDEIGDLPLSAQGLLLRAIQEGEIRRLGESVARKVNVRVLAATHRDLAAMIEAKSFRLDLYHRLRGGCVELPPLRDRGDDVLLLADRILERTGARLSREARSRLSSHLWPGNVRELQNVLAAAVALAGGRIIGPEHLELPAAGPPPGLSYHEQMDAARRRVVFGALEKHGGNQAATARYLGLSRQGLHHILQDLGGGQR
ncbi:MAG TPA: sigma 54-interacting transcriptional regulator [Thermoanaerobaculia bacterium]|nr:sigma 54-interacting transcriptional regulator [Thermoanaerobaculia bacterium]